MLTADFDFVLPPELIAQTPTAERSHSRLLVLDRANQKITHQQFTDFPNFFKAGDVLVLNDSRVIRARCRGEIPSGGAFEILLLEETAVNDWWVMLRPGKKARLGTELIFHPHSGTPDPLRAEVIEINAEGHRRLKFLGGKDVRELLDTYGEIPLPPYITRENLSELAADNMRYQTVYARVEGSVAAPTAGLHFTEPVLAELRARGVKICFVTLHVGLGTFAPVKADTLDAHVMHEERYELSEATVATITEAKKRGGKIVAGGTTTVRVLESVAAANAGELVAGSGRTRIFIFPPYQFKIVDALLTNFHLPKSTLLMLVSAFASPGETAGREFILRAYAEAVRERYRFFSYGDAMLIN